MVKEIQLTQGKVALVDDEDFERVSKHKWHVDGEYASKSVRNQLRQGRNLLMHRFILNLQSGEICDHINHNRLDNTKSNLRKATKIENGRNKIKQKTRDGNVCLSKYKGVTKSRGRWLAMIYNKTQQLFLGRYNTETDAARAYDAKARELFGEFAHLNFPD